MESKRKGAQLQIGYGGDYTYINISVVAVGALLRKYQERLLQMGNGDYTYIYIYYICGSYRGFTQKI